MARDYYETLALLETQIIPMSIKTRALRIPLRKLIAPTKFCPNRKPDRAMTNMVKPDSVAVVADIKIRAIWADSLIFLKAFLMALADNSSNNRVVVEADLCAEMIFV